MPDRTRHADWLLNTLVNGSVPGAGDIDVAFEPGFLRDVTRDAVEAQFAQLRSEAWTLEAREISEDSFGAVLRNADGAVLVRGRLEAGPDARIDAALLQPLPDDARLWSAVSDRVSASTRTSPCIDAVSDLVLALRDEHRVPALDVLVQEAGVTVHRQIAGVRDLETLEPLSGDESYRAASITKVITALALLRLVHAGVLTLDDPVSEHLRAFRLEAFDPDDRPITVRDVLSHSAGLPRDFGNRQASSMREMVGDVLRAVAPPGVRKVYSNVGFGMLGQLIEDVTGRSYAVQVQEDVLRPLGMGGSISSDGSGASLPGYDGVQDIVFPASVELVPDEATGALCATSVDLASLGRLLVAGGETFLPRTLLAEALTPTSVPGERMPPVGLGFALAEIEGQQIVWHNGSVFGWSSAWYVAPERDLVVVTLANRWNVPLDRLARQILADRLAG